MKIWLFPALLALYWLPQLAPDRDRWDASSYDLYLFESSDQRAMAVVTPDPFFTKEEGTDIRAWRAEVHVRVGGQTVTEELRFRAESIKEDTLVFIETAWGREVHVFEVSSDLAPGTTHRRRWLARAEGLEELIPEQGLF